MGHIGKSIPYALATVMYIWLSLAKDYANVVWKCIGCQNEKPETQAVPMKPIDKGTELFELWAIDYTTNLPWMEEGYRYLLLVVDVFSKQTELIPMKIKETREVE